MHDDRPPAHRAQMGKALADAVPDGREPKTDVYDSGSVFKRGTRPLFRFWTLLPHNTAWRKRAGGPPGLWISVPKVLAYRSTS